MLGALQHRGPDGSGAWYDDHCALGHQRLSILDLSDAGRQPMPNEDGTIWLTFNGEIYNVAELRRGLIERGHVFRSQTDSEVVVHGYEEWGAAVVGRLRGMFAFAVWDQRRTRLLLARDRVGKKPLVYCQTRAGLVFGSEIQALLASGLVARDPDPVALDAYFSLGYVPAPLTAFSAIRKLPPAHVFEWEPGVDSCPPPRRYWTLSHTPKTTLPPVEAQQALRATITEAVRLRLASDVPLGAFLSGGVDSCVIVGLMAALTTRPVRTFTIGFDDDRYDERALAAVVARRHGTDHQALLVNPDAGETLPRLIRHVGEPFADSSAIPTFYVSQLTRAHVTVALSGDGGDESFAGYDRYRANRMVARAQQIPGLASAARLLPDAVRAAGESRSQSARMRRFLAGLGNPPPERYARWVGASNGCLDRDARARVYTEEFLARASQRPAECWLADAFVQAGGLDPVDVGMAVDVATYLPGDLLVKADITSMANGLETRSPLLDHEVMELAASLPSSWKLRGRVSKAILKQTFADLIPPAVLAQPKRGFGVPVSEWCRTSLRGQIEDLLLSSTSGVSTYLRHSQVTARVGAHMDGQADHGRFLWMLLAFEWWHRQMARA